MKQLLFLGLSALLFTGEVKADINITLPDNCSLKSIAYYYAPIKQYAAAKTRAERGIVADSVQVVNYKATIQIPGEADSYLFGLNVKENNIPLYVAKGENINVNINSCNPFDYTLSGSNLVEGMNELRLLESPVISQYEEMAKNRNENQEELEKLSQNYTNIQKEFISANPEGAAVPVALMNLDGEDFIAIYESLPPAINNSILFPLVELQYQSEKKNIELEKKQSELQNGETAAPNFTLKDIEGKDVSLSDFRGKWVILDFWGSWCPWCIKGFPELKEAYEKYSSELVILGVDCKESEAEWKAGVEKYQLPWVNVYNPDNSSVLADYGVQGFPTKVIIDPEGKIKNITVGHNPEFFTILSNLLGK